MESVVKSIIECSIDYYRISSFTIHESGIEQSLSFRVASDLHKLALSEDNGGYVIMETSFNYLKEFSKEKRPGRRHKATDKNGRVDIAYFDQKEKLRGIFEMKRWAIFSSIEDDLRRIYAILQDNRGSDLKWGFISAPICIWNVDRDYCEKNISNIFQDLVNKIEYKYNKKFNIRYFCDFKNLNEPEKWEFDDGDSFLHGFGAICFFFKIK